MGDRAIDARYRRSFGVRAGYLPKDRAVLDEWHSALAARLQTDATAAHSPAVQALSDLLDADAIVRMYVTEMIEQARLLPDQSGRRDTIGSVSELLAALDALTRTAPTYKIGFPMSALFAYMMMTTAGEAVFRNGPFNDALRAILKEWCAFLDSEESTSTLNEGEDGWLSPEAVAKLKLDDFVIPDRKAEHWGLSPGTSSSTARSARTSGRSPTRATPR
jgi:phosphatidylserine decarboxylase